nr:MAG TPA: hypothetical protein [Caudoviricetes sp.]
MEGAYGLITSLPNTSRSFVHKCAQTSSRTFPIMDRIYI